MQEIGGFFARLSSRKFLLTLLGIVAVTLFPDQAIQISALIISFIGAEGAGDAVARYQQGKTDRELATQKQEFDLNNAPETIPDVNDVDKTNIVPGDVPM